MIQNTVVLGNAILQRLDEMLENLQLLQTDLERANLERRLSTSIPFTQDELGRALSLSPSQLQRLISTSRDKGVPVPRWRVSQREWRWDGRRGMAWAQVAGRLSGGEDLDDIPPDLLQLLREEPGPGPGPQPGEGPHIPQGPSQGHRGEE